MSTNVVIGSTTLLFIGKSGKEGDAHRQHIFAVPGGTITGRSKAESAAKRMNYKAGKV